MRTRSASLPRRGFLALGTTVGAGLVLAGCGSADPADASSGPAPAGFPVTVRGKLGAATLAAPPKRVVACGYLRDTDLAIALGANLVLSSRNTLFDSGLAAWARPEPGTELIYTDATPSFEKIAAARPDLILANDDFQPGDYPLLSKIAPTLGYATGVNADTWPDMTRRAAELLGARERAEQLIAAVQARIADGAKDHPELAGKTFSFGPVSGPDSIYTINSMADPGAALFGRLGMRLSPSVTALPGSAIPHRAQLSAEQLAVLDADVVIITYSGASVRVAFEATPVFRQLAAVRRGSYVGLDLGTAVALAFPSVLSVPYALGQVLPRLSAAARRA